MRKYGRVISIRLTREMEEEIWRMARSEGISVSELLRRIVTKAIRVKGKK